MTKVLYTVCSANHLAHCKTMADSFVKYNSDYRVIIGLVDKINDRFDPAEFLPHDLLEVDTIGIPGFDAMADQYTVLELNCAMKPFIAQYIFDKYDPTLLFYLDSDIWVKHDFSILEKELLTNDILLTPHFSSPLPDNTQLPLERDILRSGLYNAGFIALAKSGTATAFLQWWAMHMRNECYLNFAIGLGADQLWLNLVPALFRKVAVIRHPGANLAYWNLHERRLGRNNGNIVVNETEPLLFLHVSGYRFDQPEVLSRHQTRYQLNELPVLNELYRQYREAVMQNGYQRFHTLSCAFAKPPKKSTGLMKTLNKWLAPLGITLSKL